MGLAGGVVGPVRLCWDFLLLGCVTGLPEWWLSGVFLVVAGLCLLDDYGRWISFVWDLDHRKVDGLFGWDYMYATQELACLVVHRWGLACHPEPRWGG